MKGSREGFAPPGKKTYLLSCHKKTGTVLMCASDRMKQSVKNEPFSMLNCSLSHTKIHNFPPKNKLFFAKSLVRVRSGENELFPRNDLIR